MLLIIKCNLNFRHICVCLGEYEKATENPSKIMPMTKQSGGLILACDHLQFILPRQVRDFFFFFLLLDLLSSLN